jgi:tRNA A37 threonylcarbamoyladenosine modification protein TsaB
VVDLLPELEPRALDVASLAVVGLETGNTLRPEEALPVYLRDNVARENRG